MTKLTVVLTDDSIDELAAAVAERLNKDRPGQLSEGGAEENKKGSEITKKEFMAVVEEAQEASSKKQVLAVLAEFDCKNPKSVDQEDYAEIVAELGKLIDDEEEDDEEEDDEDINEDDDEDDEDDEDEDDEDEDDEDEDDEDVTVEDVKEIHTKAKKADADETKSALEEYDIKSVRGLGKLSQEDLNDLYDDLADIADE